MKNLELVIFDADGTLFDTFEMIVSAYRHVSMTHGLRVPEPDEIRALLGSPITDMFKAFYPGENIESLLETNNTYVAANVMKSEAFEGVQELLETLKERGIKLAILTSGLSNIHGVLKEHNLDNYFTSVVHGGRVKYPKPHPEGFLLACSECNVEPRKTVMVGDTPFDINAGKNAGALATIALTHGYGTVKDLTAAKPDYIAKSIFEVGELLSSSDS